LSVQLISTAYVVLILIYQRHRRTDKRTHARTDGRTTCDCKTALSILLFVPPCRVILGFPATMPAYL